jgi:hypothetical protein
LSGVWKALQGNWQFMSPAAHWQKQLRKSSHLLCRHDAWLAHLSLAQVSQDDMHDGPVGRSPLNEVFPPPAPLFDWLHAATATTTMASTPGTRKITRKVAPLSLRDASRRGVGTKTRVIGDSNSTASGAPDVRQGPQKASHALDATSLR